MRPSRSGFSWSGWDEPSERNASANREGKWVWRIYVGKPQVGKVQVGRFLFERLKNHAESIKEAENLNIKDFWCRYLVTEDVFIPLCERLLIERYKPIWNGVISGFGPKVVGKERTTQQTSMWDILHPGRHGRATAPHRKFKSATDVRKKLQEFLEKVVSGTDSPSSEAQQDDNESGT